MPACQNPKCGRPIPEERLHQFTLPAVTCSKACAVELKKIRNRKHQADFRKRKMDGPKVVAQQEGADDER